MLRSFTHFANGRINHSSLRRQRADTEGKNPYRWAGPNFELPSIRMAALKMYLSLNAYWPFTSAPMERLCIWVAVRFRSVLAVREGTEGSCRSVEAVFDVCA